MKTIHLSLLLLLFVFFSSFATKPIDVNPINLAVTLVEMTDSSEIVSTLKYYGFTEEPKSSEFNVYDKPDGTIVKYKFTENGQSLPYPIIDISSKRGFIDRDKILKDLDFKKKGNSYERIKSKSSKYSTICIPIGKSDFQFKRRNIINIP